MIEGRRRLSPPTRLLSTNDIPGATVRTSRKPIVPQNSPPDGSIVTMLIPLKVSKQNNFNISNADIPHSMPESKMFKTNRACDPLNPTYKVASYPFKPATPPKFLNETLKTSDIAGTTPTPVFRYPIRTLLQTRDIFVPNSSIKKRITPGFGLMTSDINNPEGVPGFKTTRVTNPLSPRYRVAGAPESIHSIGNKPKPAPKAKQPHEAMFSLKSKDIDGCTSEYPIPYPRSRRHWRETCNLSDMPFACPTAKHSVMHISTDRITDPNNPRYPPLEHKPIKLSEPAD